MKIRVFHIICLCIFLALSPALAGSKHQVLVIHSYHRGFTWTDEIDAALRKVLETSENIEITTEYLDSKRWPLDRVAPAFMNLLDTKYGHAPPRAIILSDNNALAFMDRYYQSRFPGVPVVFCGINNFTPDLIKNLGNAVTGVVERTDPGGTVDLIKRLQPGLKKLAIVTGTSPTARAIKSETRKALAERAEGVSVLWLDGLATAELSAGLKSLTPWDAVLLIAFNRDRDGVYYTYEESARLIASWSPAPVYGLWNFYLGTGVVGGRMVYSRDQGTLAGEKCLAILKEGKIPPISRNSPNTVLIDYPSFRARGLNDTRLPEGALVVNKPRTFYETHKKQLLAVSGFITVLLIMVLTLAANIIRRRESDKKYRLLFESSMDAIFLITPDLEIIDCNPAAFKLFRIPSKAAFLGLSPVTLSPDRQPDGTPSGKKAAKMMAIAMEKGLHLFEWRHRRYDGEEFDASVLLSFTSIGGRSIIQATARDISDQKLAQEMLIQSEKMMSVGGLAAGMAHEINNPLAGMIQNAAVLANRITRTDMPANKEAAQKAGTTMTAVARYMELRDIPKMAAAITDSGTRIATIVGNMLSFARKGGTAFTPHHPADLVDKVVELAATDFNLKKQYDFKRIIIQKEYEPDLPMVACQGSKIQQVLLNILKNGAQAMLENPGEKPPRFILRLAHDRGKETLRIEVEDNGPGMDRQTRNRIFEPFFTTKPIGVGTGLGLSVSYFIITDNHRGTMSVSSEPGQGATFTICLPLNLESADAETEAS